MAGISLLSSCLLVAGLAAAQQEPTPTSKPTDKPASRPADEAARATRKEKAKEDDEDEGKKPEQPPCQVRIRVVDPAGKPVARVGVVLAKEDLQTQQALNEPTFRGDADGKVEFMLPAPADDEDTTGFTMLLAAPGRMAHSRTLSYPKNQDKPELDLGEIILGPGVTLEGRVRGEDGRPVAGAKITAADSMARPVFTRYGGYDPSLSLHRSHAVSDDHGVFLLPGVHASAMHLTITADGHERQELPAVSVRQPLDVTLHKTGFVSGKVVDDEGQPIEDVYVRISYELDSPTGYSSSSSSKKTGPDGTFKISLRHRHRYRLNTYATGKRARLYKKGYSEVLDAPKQDLILKMERLVAAKPAAAAGTGILLRVTDAGTGGVVEKFKAAALWMNIQPYTQERYIQSQFRSLAREAKMPGELRLIGPKDNQPQSGIVIVEAKGYAQLKINDVNWSEEELVKLDAKLVKESVIAGVIVDETTKKPVAGAKVYAVPEDASSYMQRIYYGNTSPDQSNAVTTDDKGAFRIGGLGKGKYKVHVSKVHRPGPKPLKVELGEAEHHTEVSLAIPRGTRVTGRIVGTKPQPGWRVKLVPRQDLNRNVRYYYSYSPYSRSPGPTTALAADGGFEFKGLAKGAYDLRILIPRGPRCGPPIELFIDPLRLRAADITRDFDASQDRPAIINGKLKVSGAPIPLDRLVVVATDFGAGYYNYYARMDSSLMGARSLPKRDGSFELLVNKGIHQLKVVDLETGIALLKKEDGIEVEAGQTVSSDLELTVTMARVTLKPAKEDGRIVASHLEVNVQHPKPKSAVMFFGSSPTNTGVGVSLADGKRKVNLFLPLLETKLAVRTNTQRLHKNASGNSPTLADHEFTPKAGETNKVELLVAAPPEVKDPDEADPKVAAKAAEPRAAAAMARALEAAKAKVEAKKAAAKEKAAAKKEKQTKQEGQEEAKAGTDGEPSKKEPSKKEPSKKEPPPQPDEPLRKAGR